MSWKKLSAFDFDAKIHPIIKKIHCSFTFKRKKQNTTHIYGICMDKIKFLLYSAQY